MEIPGLGPKKIVPEPLNPDILYIIQTEYLYHIGHANGAQARLLFWRGVWSSGRPNSSMKSSLLLIRFVRLRLPTFNQLYQYGFQRAVRSGGYLFLA